MNSGAETAIAKPTKRRAPLLSALSFLPRPPPLPAPRPAAAVAAAATLLSRLGPAPHCDRLRAFDRVIKNPILLFPAKYNPRGPITFSITAFNCALLFDAGIVPRAQHWPYVNQRKKRRAKMFTRVLESDRCNSVTLAGTKCSAPSAFSSSPSLSLSLSLCLSLPLSPRRSPLRSIARALHSR